MSAPAPAFATLGLRTLLERALRDEFHEPVITPSARYNPVFLANKCLITECVTQTGGRQLCTAHRREYARTGGAQDVPSWAASVSPLRKTSDQLVGCAVSGCGRGGRLCARHLVRWKSSGEGLSMIEWAAGQPVEPIPRLVRLCRLDGCQVWAEPSTHQLCRSHAARWRSAGKPAIEEFLAYCRCYGLPRFDLRGLPEQLQLELGYGLQCRADDGATKTFPWMVGEAVRELRDRGVESVYNLPADYWTGRVARRRVAGRAFVAFTRERLDDLRAAHDGTEEWDRDRWILRRLPGLPRSERAALDFTGIPQPWLRQLAKRFARERAVRGLSIGTLASDVHGLTLFAGYLATVVPNSTSAAVITRPRIEDYLAQVLKATPAIDGQHRRISVLSVFLTRVQRGDWATDLPRTARIYPEDFPRRVKTAPRFLSEQVMAQIENPVNLARLPTETRLMTQILIGTGLRILDTCRLRIDCVRTDNDGCHYLLYRNHKMKRDAAVPITAELAALIGQQAARALGRYPNGTNLFPKRGGNQHGRHPRSTSSYRTALVRWLTDTDLRDEHGRPVTVTAHRFRHTYATRFINAGVSEEVLRRLLDHSSSAMVQRYGRIHDSTVRRQWEQAQKVNAFGQSVVIDPESPLADAEWIKQNLTRARMSLPNGYCGLPLSQTCPHANACLACPLFLTTPDFLPQHREQLTNTRRLIASARADGKFRMVEMNEQVEANLVKIIDALETPKDSGQ